MIANIIGISGSPRRDGNTDILVQEAMEGARSVHGIRTRFLSLAGKKINHCTGCLSCQKKGTICVFRDDFPELFNSYMEADGLIIGSPVYHLSITSTLKALIDRLGQSMFSIYKGRLPRLCKSAGVIIQGNSLFGGQEYAQQFLINSFILENCLVVSGDKPKSKLGVLASTGADSARGSIRKNEDAMMLSRTLGRRVAEMARIIKAGMDALFGELGPEYFERKHLEPGASRSGDSRTKRKGEVKG